MIKIIISAVLLFSVLFLSSTSKTEEFKRPEIENYKNLAFCYCLDSEYPSYDNLLNEGSASGFFQVSDITLSEIELLDSLAIDYSKKKYLSSTKANLGLMKCLDFYNSEELDLIVKNLLSEK